MAYIYHGAECEGGLSVMTPKVQGAVSVTLQKVVLCAEYVYLVFADALGAADKSNLDDFMSSRGGEYASIDRTPDGVVCIGTSPDGSIWKFVLDNQGVITTEKPTTA